MASTDIEQANRWIYGKLIAAPVLVSAVGVHPELNIPQFYAMGAPQNTLLSLQLNLPNANVGVTSLAVTLNKGKFAQIPVGTYFTNQGKSVTISSSNIVNGAGTITVSALSASLVSGDFITVSVPQIVFRYVGGNVKRGTGGRKIFSKLTYDVVALCAGDSMSPIVGLAAELEKQFQVSQLDGDTVTIGCSIIQPICFDEILDSGVRVFHLGHMLEIFTYNSIP
jgi:hypothetical protein